MMLAGAPLPVESGVWYMVKCGWVSDCRISLLLGWLAFWYGSIEPVWERGTSGALNRMQGSAEPFATSIGSQTAIQPCTEHRKGKHKRCEAEPNAGNTVAHTFAAMHALPVLRTHPATIALRSAKRGCSFSAVCLCDGNCVAIRGGGAVSDGWHGALANGLCYAKNGANISNPLEKTGGSKLHAPKHQHDHAKQHGQRTAYRFWEALEPFHFLGKVAHMQANVYAGKRQSQRGGGVVPRLKGVITSGGGKHDFADENPANQHVAEAEKKQKIQNPAQFLPEGNLTGEKVFGNGSNPFAVEQFMNDK